MLKFVVLLAAVGVCESVTCTVKFDELVNVPDGIPEITPVAAFSDNPCGRLPAVMLHL
jgi:hypothetical protein